MVLQILFFSFLAVTIGLAFTFMGYAMFRILLPIWAFFSGFWLGGAMVSSFMNAGFMEVSLSIIAGVVIGLIFAVIAYFVYSLAVIIFGASLGFAIGQGFMLLIGFNVGIWSWLAGFILAVVFALGFMTFKFPKILVMAATALAGSSAIIAGFLALFGQVDPSKLGLAQASATIHSSWFWWIVWFALAIFGAVVQSAMSEAAAFNSYGYDEYMLEAEEEKEATK